jgi:hypothetical protein
MTSVREAIKRLIEPKVPLSAGIFHYQSPPDAGEPYRLHLRIENDGQGTLIVNASTILHLNKTATEYAFHLIKQSPMDEMLEQISARYRVNKKAIIEDFENFKDNLAVLLETPDLDPESFLGFNRTAPYPDDLSAPYRLDCAITYMLPEGVDPNFAPTKRVDRELTTQEWKEIFEKAWQIGIPHLIFTGGEPTLRDDIFELLEYAEQLGQVTGLCTDGRKLSDVAYFEKLLNTGLDHLMLIFDPDDDNSWSTIQQCVEADIFFTTHLTISIENAINISDVIAKLNDMGVINLSLSTANPALFSKLSELRELTAEQGLSLIWDIPVPYSAFNPIALELREDVLTSGAGRAWLYIEPDGDVLPTQGADVKLGNVLSDPWDLIWSNARNFDSY